MSAIIISVGKKHPNMEFSEDLLKECEKQGYVSTTVELYKLQPTVLIHPFMGMLAEVCSDIHVLTYIHRRRSCHKLLSFLLGMEGCSRRIEGQCQY